jgi:tripartite-type tricarboxylate transporter receptor subunit TctC
MEVDMKNVLFSLLSLAFVSAGLYFGTAQAQSYPTKTVRLVVPFPPGGGTDGVARSISSGLSKSLGQPVVVENRPGAGGLVAWSQVSRATPDGYTLVMIANNLRLYRLMRAKVDFDPDNDLVPVAAVASVPMVLAGSKADSAATLRELVSIGRTSPGKLNFGHPGAGGPHHLAYALFSAETGVNFTLVPYKGTGPLMSDLLGGRIDVAFLPLSAARPHFDSGRLRNYGVASPRRTDLAPDLPTVAENGGPSFDASYWFAVAVPKGTPRPIIERLAAEINALTATPAIRESMHKQGFEPMSGNSEQTDQALAEEVKKWGRSIREHGIFLE